MKNKTTSAERLFQDVRTSSEEMTSSDVKKVTKMDPKWVKMDQMAPPCYPGALWAVRDGGRSRGGPEVVIYK